MNETIWSETEKNWFKENFSVSDKEVSAWQKHGFSMGEAIEWSHWDVTAVRAAQAIKAGVNQVPDYFLNRNGMSLDSALEWDSHGFGMEEAQMWSDSGIDCEDAIILRNQGLTADSVSDFTFWGLSISQAVNWLAVGFDGNTAKDWIDWDVSCDKAKKFADDGVFEPPADEFRDAGLTLTEAMKWAKSDIDFDTAFDWIDWKVPTDSAIELVLKDEWPPGKEFKELGLSYKAAMEWCSEFSEDEIEYSENGVKSYWKIWFNAGFNAKTAKVFQAELSNFIKESLSDDFLARKLPAYLVWFSEEDRDAHFKYLFEECVETIGELSAAGMKITIENLVLWRGLTHSQILACVDGGIDAETGYLLGDSVLSADTIEMHALLRANGFYSSPKSFKLLGLSNSDLEKLIKLKVDLDDFLNVSRFLKIPGSELVKWVTAFRNHATKIEKVGNGKPRPLIEDWIDERFNPKDAWRWHSEEFTAATAKVWIDSGVTDPKIAARRKNAGLEPK
jgi:hypothetical protein